MTSCFTRTGDQGETCLFTGDRVSKSEQRIEGIGSIDELNSFLGWAASFSENPEIKKMLQSMQNDLFSIGAELAGSNSKQESKIKISPKNTATLEKSIKDCEEQLPVQRKFIIPSGTRAAMTLNVARSVCRRAERVLVKLDQSERLNPHILSYVNRMSDLLHLLTRMENLDQKIEEKNPLYHYSYY